MADRAVAKLEVREAVRDQSELLGQYSREAISGTPGTIDTPRIISPVVSRGNRRLHSLRPGEATKRRTQAIKMTQALHDDQR